MVIFDAELFTCKLFILYSFREEEMEEIVFDPTQVVINQEALASLEELISRSKNEGPQIGIPWNKKVFDYMFESEVFVDPSVLLGDNYYFVEVEDDFI